MILFNLKTIIDNRGTLIAANSLPFNIKRVFILKNVKHSRGQHAHKLLKELLIAVSGSCMVELDFGKEVTQVNLDSPEKGLLIPPLCWRTLKNFSKDCIILSLCSEPLEENDYIRDYNEFKSIIKQLG